VITRDVVLFSLGHMYANGLGVPQDYTLALRCFHKAARQGNSAAQNTLGLMYRNGIGTPQDYALAIHWYRRAAEQRLADAQNHLGFMYYKGLGVPQDYMRAYAWFNLAAAQGHQKARKSRQIAVGKLTPERVAEGQKLSRKLWNRLNKR